MQDLKTLDEVCTKLKEVSSSIINKSLLLINEISIDDSDLYENFRMLINNDNMSDEDIDKCYNNALTDYISDAKKISSELDTFTRFILKKGSYDGFLLEIWSGDVYDSEGIDGLVEFLEELESQENSLTLETITQNAIDYA